MKEMRKKGFTLVETAIVLTIVGFLMAGGMNLLTSSTDTARYKETQNQMSEVREALMSYFIQYDGVLPCPDLDNDTSNVSYGQSDYDSGDAITGGVCKNYQGWLPHITLGLGGNGDAWGERYKYVVSRAFTQEPNDSNGKKKLCTASSGEPFSRQVSSGNAWQISIYGLGDTSSTVPAKPSGAALGDWAAFAIISTGKNGKLANSGITSGLEGAFHGCAALDKREQYHCTSTSPSPTQAYFLRSGVPQGDANNVLFDDLVVWGGDVQLSGQLLKSGSCIGINAPKVDESESTTPSPTPETPPAEETTTPAQPKGGCSVAQSGNDFGLIVLLLVAFLGVFLRMKRYR